jgi:hypothetical protein
MRFPLVRLTPRRRLILVAIGVLALAAESTRLRSCRYSQKARFFAEAERIDRHLLAGGTVLVQAENGHVDRIATPWADGPGSAFGCLFVTRHRPPPNFDAEFLRVRADFHSYLSAAYDRAARAPWLPLEFEVPEHE